MRIQYILAFLIGSAVLGAQGTGKIEGTVRAAPGRTPMPQVRVVLGNLMPNQAARTTMTNKDGAFVFNGVPPSDFPYFVKIEQDGYRQQDVTVQVEETTSSAGSGQLTVQIRAGTQVHADFLMTTTGTIGGHIADPDGHVIANTTVELVVAGTAQHFAPLPKTVVTDASGRYRFEDVLPGRYYVEASTGRSIVRPDTYRRASTVTVKDPFSATYYPGVSSKDAAAWVDIIPGAELTAIDYRLLPVSPLRITGHIVNKAEIDVETDPDYRNSPARSRGAQRTGKPELGVEWNTSYSFYLVPQNSPPREDSVIGPIPNYSDTALGFELRNIRPGAYDLVVEFLPNTGDGYIWQSWVGHRAVNIDHDLEDVDILIERNAELTGRIVLHESVSRRGLDLSTIKPTFVRADAAPKSLNIDSRLQRQSFVQSDGTFRIPEGMSPGRYWVSMMPWTLPAGLYLSAASMDGSSALGTPVIISPGGSYHFVLELRGDGGQVQGTVQDKNSRPAANADVLLFLFELREDPGAYRFARADGKGQFKFEGIPPGTYTVLAFTGPLKHPASLNPEFIKAYVLQGKSVKVDKGLTVRADVAVISPP